MRTLLRLLIKLSYASIDRESHHVVSVTVTLQHDYVQDL